MIFPSKLSLPDDCNKASLEDWSTVKLFCKLFCPFISATACSLIFDPANLFTKPPTTLSPPPIAAPQGPGIAEAIPLSPLIILPAPEVIPPDIAPPTAPPTAFPAALNIPPAPPVPIEPNPLPVLTALRKPPKS